MNDWKKFEEALPTDQVGKQVRVLLGHPDWATCEIGLYSHFVDESLENRIAEYDSKADRYYDWETTLPTHWILLPKNPTA